MKKFVLASFCIFGFCVSHSYAQTTANDNKTTQSQTSSVNDTTAKITPVISSSLQTLYNAGKGQPGILVPDPARPVPAENPAVSGTSPPEKIINNKNAPASGSADKPK